jgi:DNA repair photolyase
LVKEASIQESSYANCIDFYELDLTTTCSVGCIYCGLRKSGERFGLLDIQDILTSGTPQKGIYLSPNTDPFFRDAAKLSHKVLERFLPEGVPFLIITKQKIPDETIELLSRFPEQVIAKVSLARLDQRLNAYIEPAAASAQARLNTIRSLAEAGLSVQALMMPVYPAVDDSDEKLEAIIVAFAQAGVSMVKAAFVLMRDGDSAKDSRMLRRMLAHPVLKKSWRLLREEIKPLIGTARVPTIDYRIRFYEQLAQLCNGHGMEFAACSVLDPPALELARGRNFISCRSVWMFQEKCVVLK